MKTGIYETEYGNAALVDEKAEGLGTTMAFDLDQQAKVPMTLVTQKWLRDADDSDYTFDDDYDEDGLEDEP